MIQNDAMYVSTTDDRDEKYPMRNVETDSDSDHGGKRTSWCLDNDKEQALRQELIQRATTRLRKRLLEQGLQDVMSQVVSLQTQLESLRVDAAITIDTISDIFEKEDTDKMNRQMDVLERRLESHKSTLYQFVAPEINAKQQQPIEEHEFKKKPEPSSNPLAALSMSRLSSLSLMSSIFGRSSAASSVSSRATSISEQDQVYDDDCISHIESIQGVDDPFYDLAGKRSFKAGSFCGSVYHEKHQQPIMAPNRLNSNADIRYRRRQRRQRHQQKHQQQQYDNESVLSDDNVSFSTISSLDNDVYCHPLSPMTPPANFNQFLYNNQLQGHHFLTQSWLSSVPMMEKETMPQIQSQRNVLDDAMSFLDGLSENGDDGGFGEDVYLLLRNPDLCCRPLSEIQSTMQELRQQEERSRSCSESTTTTTTKDMQPKQLTLTQLFNPAIWCQLGLQLSSDMAYKVTCSSLQWCRFLSVLAAAVVISLLKGPEDIRRYSATF